MPELHDVEVSKRYLDATGLHRSIESVEVTAPRLLQGVSEERLRETLVGRELTGTRRHGKWLFAGVGEPDGEPGDHLVLHFGMTGFLRCYRKPEGEPDHVRLRLDYADGYRLAYDNQRMFGEIGLASDVDSFVRKRDLGPDALDLAAGDGERFRELLADRRGIIKPTLMNQSVLAGIGNELSDEVLFQARIHPERTAGELSPAELDTLHSELGRVLEAAIAAGEGGVIDPVGLPEGFLNRHREEGAPCPAGCGGALERIEVSGRTGYHCPRCQKR